MKIIIADRNEYNDYFSKKIDKLRTFELANQEDYIIHRIEFENGENDVSLMYICINNLLKKQYERNSYISIEELKEIDELFHKLNKEQCKIVNAYAEIKNYSIKNLNEIKELISNIEDYKIIEKYNLHEVGVLIAEKSSKYHMDIDVIEFVNFEKLAERYLWDSNIKENFCSYGLLVDTKEIFENELIQPKIDKDKMFKVEVVNKKEFEELQVYSKVTIYLPMSKEELQEKFKEINLDYSNFTIQDTHVTKCELVNFGNKELTKDFNESMEEMIDRFANEEGNTTPFQEIENLYKEVKKFDNIQMEKFIALVDAKECETTYIHDLVKYAKELKKYELLPNVTNFKEMGEHLVNETGHFDDVSLLDDYIDYYKLGVDYTRKGYTYSGVFTKYGYVMEKEDFQKEEESEEEFEG